MDVVFGRSAARSGGSETSRHLLLCLTTMLATTTSPPAIMYKARSVPTILNARHHQWDTRTSPCPSRHSVISSAHPAESTGGTTDDDEDDDVTLPDMPPAEDGDGPHGYWTVDTRHGADNNLAVWTQDGPPVRGLGMGKSASFWSPGVILQPHMERWGFGPHGSRGAQLGWHNIYSVYDDYDEGWEQDFFAPITLPWPLPMLEVSYHLNNDICVSKY